jgi:NAD(P)H-hydrate epimerase
VKPVLTTQQVRELENAAAGQGVTIADLMENAGNALAEVALRLASPRGKFIVLCGHGNNGGDGFVAARRLVQAGRVAQVELIGRPEELKGEPRRNYAALSQLGIVPASIPRESRVGEGDVVIDALLGTGLNRAPSGAYADAIERIAAWRASGTDVLSADIPSGLDSDTGQPYEPCVQADATVSFGVLKRGQVLEPGASLCGELQVVDIGLPPLDQRGGKAPQIFLLDESDVRAWVPRRSADSHKGTYGHVLVIAGSPGKSGAAALSALAVLRGGAGLSTVACRENVLSSILGHAPELMGHILSPGEALGPDDLPALSEAAQGKSAVVIGPGIARGPETHELMRELLAQFSVPFLIDADGLNALVGHLDVLEAATGPVVVTPHPGEMARLLGTSTAEVQQDRIKAARSLAADHDVTVVLKGARTLVTMPDGAVLINPTGNPGMATGGTGDVLSGICGALLAQGLSPERAAAVAVYAHGMAGDLAAATRGQMGLIASDLLAELGRVWSRWKR